MAKKVNYRRKMLKEFKIVFEYICDYLEKEYGKDSYDRETYYEIIPEMIDEVWRSVDVEHLNPTVIEYAIDYCRLRSIYGLYKGDNSNDAE